MDKPVICFDLDGTLVDEQGKIHPRDVALLRQPDPPAVFVPCTGRLLPSVRKLFSRHQAFPGGLQPGAIDQAGAAKLPWPQVLQNGAALYGPGEALVSYHCFSESLRRSLVDEIARTPEVAFLVFTEQKVYIAHPDDFSRSILPRFDLDAEPFPLDQEMRFSKVMALSPHPGRLQEIEARTAGEEIEQSYSLETVLELTPAGIHKGRGVSELLDSLGWQGSPLLAAGDGGNDLPLFELTGHTFAPQTAPDEIKARASRIVDTAQSGLLEPLLQAAARL